MYVILTIDINRTNIQTVYIRKADMQIFKINETIEIVCQYESTRSGFRHLASFMYNGIEREKAKACYSNRTWEAHEFDSVMLSLAGKVEKSGFPEYSKLIKEFVANR